VTNQYGALLPTDGTNMLFMEGTNGTGAVVSSDLVPITGGLTYALVFDAANPVQLNGGNPQYQLQFFDAGNGFISATGFGSLISVGSSFTSVSNNYAAPANAASVQVQFLEAVGGGAHWVTLIDHIRFSALATTAGTNVLSPTIQLGAAFTATVMSNGVVIATSASGTIAFLTNSAGLSTNNVALGSATSATAILTPPYTVTAIYSGDSTYMGSTNTLTVSHAVAGVTLGNLNQTFDGTAKSATAITTPAGLTVIFTYNGSTSAPTNVGTYQVIGTVSDPVYVGSATNNLVIVSGTSNTPTNITATVSGSQLTISWPADHLGWILQSNVNLSDPTNWFDLPGSGTNLQQVINIDPANPNVFFRLRSP
jgi:hypothetical protein